MRPPGPEGEHPSAPDETEQPGAGPGREQPESGPFGPRELERPDRHSVPCSLDLLRTPAQPPLKAGVERPVLEEHAVVQRGETRKARQLAGGPAEPGRGGRGARAGLCAGSRGANRTRAARLPASPSGHSSTAGLSPWLPAASSMFSRSAPREVQDAMGPTSWKDSAPS